MKKMKVCFCMALIILGVNSIQLVAADTQGIDVMDSWAQDYVERANSLRLVPPIFDNLTLPITRAEFTDIAVRLYEMTTDREITGRMEFNDTDDINVQKMGYLGVVAGVGGGNFAPYNTLTREQAALMISRLAYAIGQPFPSSRPTFSDNENISSWAVVAVGQMQENGIMGGTGSNNFSPRDDYTIQQSIVTMLRLFDILTRDEPTNDIPNFPYAGTLSVPAGLTMNVLSYSSSDISFYFVNLTDSEVIYGEEFALYAFINYEWQRVEPIVDGFFPSVAHIILPNSSSNERTIDWVWLFGELPSGDYRFQKDILYVRQAGDADRFVLESDFTLS